MASEVPSTMLAVALDKHCNPSDYNVATLPRPRITQPEELLIKVHAVSVNPIDVKMASSLGKMLGGATFPYKLCHDLSGTIVAVGSGVTSFKPGDEIYSRVDEMYRGTLAEFALSDVARTALKPASLSFAEAASMPLAAQTALQALDVAEARLPGGLKGKTVYIPAGLSGTGHFAVQLARILGAGKVITTLSTGKVETIKELLGERGPDQIVDYTKENVNKAIGKASVDFMFDTVGETVKALPVMKKGGLVVSISTLPSGTQMKKMNRDLPWYLGLFMNVADWALRSWASLKGVGYVYLLLEGSAKDLGRLSKWVEEGKLKPVVGRTAKMENIEDVRSGCQQILDGKGGVGKFVIEIV